jgi:4-amino-4-deoxy-L-arabinose transferase-like glycosyltransferase
VGSVKGLGRIIERNKRVQIIANGHPSDYLGPVATEVEPHNRSLALTLAVARIRRPSWPAPAWGAIGVTALFIGITCWWLSRDHHVPIWDAGLHLDFVFNVHQSLSEGNLGAAFTCTAPYPPFAYLVGSLGVTLGGLGVTPVILTENVFFVSLLALGCYQLGRLAFGPLAGLLAVVFALGSPLIIGQFHLFLTDAPETAMVAVSVWLVIATDRFSRPGVSAIAGIACGLGMLTKEPFVVFVIGVVGVTAVRGGRQAWRGLAIFAVIALALALPWYIHERAQIEAIKTEATAASTAIPKTGAQSPQGIAPPRLSQENLQWYLWNFINWQLYLPLFLFTAVGWLWTIWGFLRRRPVSRLAVELTVGAFVGWLAVTETYVHDVRYGMPLLVYLAVFGTGWIVRLTWRWRTIAATALVLVAVANTAGVSFGVGKEVGVTLPGFKPGYLEDPGEVSIYESGGFAIGAPTREGNLLAMLQALRRNGVRSVTWPQREALEPDFTDIGVTVLSRIADLNTLSVVPVATSMTRQDAVFLHTKIQPNETPPCVNLEDHTGVWVRIGNPVARGAQDYCPLPRPHYYGPREP